MVSFIQSAKALKAYAFVAGGALIGAVSYFLFGNIAGASAAVGDGTADADALISLDEVSNQVKDVALEQSGSFISIITDLLPYMIALVVSVGLIFGVYRFLKGLVMRIGRG